MAHYIWIVYPESGFQTIIWAFQETIRKMEEVKDSYVGAMDAEFNTYSEFEHKRLDFTR